MASTERQEVVKRISKLEQYRLPKPLPNEQLATAILGDDGTVIGLRGNLRRRLKTVRIGRPEEHRIKVRAALEEKLAHPRRTWRSLAQQFGLPSKDLERQIRLLKNVLQREGIPLPTAEDYRRAQNGFEDERQQFRTTRSPE